MVEYNWLLNRNNQLRRTVTRIIKTSTPGKERAKLSKAIVIAVREFMRQEKPDKTTSDIVAFIILALNEISYGIENSVAAWEKRGYWVKADKYRLNWQWSGDFAEKITQAYEKKDWDLIAELLLKIMIHFEDIKVSDRHRLGQPWVGAAREYQNIT